MLPYLKQTKKNLWWLMILLFVYLIFIISEPYFYKLFIDWVTDFANQQKTLGETSDHLFKLSLIWWIIISLSIAAYWVYDYMVHKINHKDWEHYITFLWFNFINLTIDKHISTDVWERQKVFDRGAEALFQVGLNILDPIVPSFFTFVFLLILWVYVNWQMTLVSLFLLPLSIFFIVFIWAKAYKRQNIANKKWDQCFWRFSDALTNIFVIKVFSCEDKEKKIMDDWFEKAIDSQMHSSLLWTYLYTGLNYIWFLWRISVLIVWVFFIINWKLSLGELFLFITLSSRIYWPLNSLFKSYEEMTKNLSNYYKAQEIIKTPKEIDNWKKIFNHLKEKIEFKNATFVYPDDSREVLSNVNFDIKKWQKIAFVWHTWSWKSTLIKLLIRFYDLKSWNILIDWEDIQDYTMKSYRSSLWVVFQDTTLFNDTIINNLKYIKDTNIEEIIKACSQAHILKFINSLPKWFNTVLWERWLKLSGWERQRMAIARTLLADPDILILDEATSSLDSKTEKDIQMGFENLMKWRTSIIIAHRLSTVKNVDKIFLFENWKIISSWNHRELYKKSLIYKELVDYQKDWLLE